MFLRQTFVLSEDERILYIFLLLRKHGIISRENAKKIYYFVFFLSFYFLNYENMVTHLQETWKTQSKVTYSSTIYYNSKRTYY